jgi:hypothetical protein
MTATFNNIQSGSGCDRKQQILLTKTLNSIKAECSKHIPIVYRINAVLAANEFFKSLPDKDRLNLIKQQMEKYDISLELLEEYHKYYHITSLQTLWEIINKLENKCKPDLINNQQLTQ